LWVPVVAAPHLARYGFAGNRRATSGVKLMDWARILAFVTGTVDQELLARIEYLAAENRIAPPTRATSAITDHVRTELSTLMRNVLGRRGLTGA
jgi:hypothetical protein